MLEKITDLYQNLPEKKKYIDLVTAVLTIPVLLTVIISNLGNLDKKPNKEFVSAQIPQPTIEKIIIRDTETPIPVNVKETIEPSETPGPSIVCKSGIPAIEIISPSENEKITTDPVCITFRQTDNENYCSYLHAYRINSSSWSTYNKDPICLYNMASGEIKLDIKIKSSLTGEENSYSRNFNYQNKNVQVQASPTVQVQPSVTAIPTL